MGDGRIVLGLEEFEDPPAGTAGPRPDALDTPTQPHPGPDALDTPTQPHPGPDALDDPTEPHPGPAALGTPTEPHPVPDAPSDQTAPDPAARLSGPPPTGPGPLRLRSPERRS